MKNIIQILFGKQAHLIQNCKHTHVDQGWMVQGILERVCVNCKKRESWDTNKRFNTLWNPEFINDEPIGGIELEKMKYHQEWLNTKK